MLAKKKYKEIKTKNVWKYYTYVPLHKIAINVLDGFWENGFYRWTTTDQWMITDQSSSAVQYNIPKMVWKYVG